MPMPIQERLGLHIKRVEQELMAAKHAALRPIGLTVPQYAALLCLGEQPGISAAALARMCLVTPQTISTVLGNLEDKGLITRRPHPWHRRVAEIQLTSEGQRLLAKADALAVEIERRLAAGYTPAEHEQLIRLLARLSDSLAAPHSKPAGEIPHAPVSAR
jgi:DNA-binding MarR family transcriptional regulator